MIVILHMEDDPHYWIDNIHKHESFLADVVGRPVRVLPRDSVARAVAVLLAAVGRSALNPQGDSVADALARVKADKEMKDLARQGYKLKMLVLDLLMEGGTRTDVENWLRAVKGLSIGQLTYEDIDPACPALAVGRTAAASGIKAVILTNAEKFLPEEELGTKKEHQLLMSAAGASAYIAKEEQDWQRKLGTVLTGK